MAAAPVALIIFNRPDKALKVLERIRQWKPKELFILADGPRALSNDAARCKVTREAIEGAIDWPCEVARHYRQVNGGINEGVCDGLTWLFSQTERAIILEDDCLPHPSFFPYADELLDRYADDERICHIAGTDMQLNTMRGPDSYHFAMMGHIWGWASWARTWRQHIPSCGYWPAIADDWTQWIGCGSARSTQWFKNFGDRAYSGICGWDMCYTLGCWVRDQMTITPNGNLIENTGADGTGIGAATFEPLAMMPTRAMRFPLRHPKTVEINPEAHRFAMHRELGDLDRVLRTVMERCAGE